MQLREKMLVGNDENAIKMSFSLCGCIRRARGPRTRSENDCVLLIGKEITLNCERGSFVRDVAEKSGPGTGSPGTEAD